MAPLSLALNRQGTRAAANGILGRVHVGDVMRDRHERTFDNVAQAPGHGMHGEMRQSLAFTEDGDWLFAPDTHDRGLRILHVPSGKSFGVLRGDAPFYKAMAISLPASMVALLRPGDDQGQGPVRPGGLAADIPPAIGRPSTGSGFPDTTRRPTLCIESEGEWCGEGALAPEGGMMDRFHDRREAGRQLAARLTAYANRPDVLVLALPRGGVPVAYEVARALGAPLDVFIVRKLGVPGYEELAMGAVATGGVRVLNDQIVRGLDIPEYMIDAVTTRERQELARRERLYRGDRPPPDVHGRTVILVDDGLATGATMHAAIAALRQQQPARIVVAVPTASREVCDAFRAEADDVVCAITPEPFQAVGLWYEDFSQTSDEEVRDLLARAARETRAA
jgi:predicted phosphoribosyltransferase